MRALQPSENCLGAFGVVDSSSAAVVSHLPGASGNQERKFSPCKRPGNLYGIATVVDRLTQRLRSEEHTSELQSRLHLVCRLLLEKKKEKYITRQTVLQAVITPSRHTIRRIRSISTDTA